MPPSLASERTTVRDPLFTSAAGCPEPTFEATGFFTTTFLPNPAVRAQAEAQGRDQVTEQAGTKLALSRHQVEILAKCVEDQPLN